MSGESFAGSLLSKAVGIVLEARTQSTVAANRNTKFNIASLSSALSEQRQGNTLTIEFLSRGSPCERWVWTQEASTALGERDQPEVPVLYKRAVIGLRSLHCLLRALPAHLLRSQDITHRVVPATDCGFEGNFSRFDLAPMDTPGGGRITGCVVYTTITDGGLSGRSERAERAGERAGYYWRRVSDTLAMAPPAARVEVPGLSSKKGSALPMDIPRLGADALLEQAEHSLGSGPHTHRGGLSRSPSLPFALTPQPHSASEMSNGLQFLAGRSPPSRRLPGGDGHAGVSRPWTLASSSGLTSLTGMFAGLPQSWQGGLSPGSSGSAGARPELRAASSSFDGAVQDEMLLPFALDTEPSSDGDVGALVELLQDTPTHIVGSSAPQCMLAEALQELDAALRDDCC